MKTKPVKFNPKLGFADDILSGKKAQTIRDKPIDVGQKISLWEMWRGMKKGYYCTKCFRMLDVIIFDKPHHVACGDIRCGGIVNILEQFPHKLLETKVKECVPIEMKWVKLCCHTKYRLKILFPKEKCYLAKDVVEIFYDDGQHPFVKADTPKMTDKEFIDLMLELWPDIRKGWVKLWIWKW